MLREKFVLNLLLRAINYLTKFSEFIFRIVPLESGPFASERSWSLLVAGIGRMSSVVVALVETLVESLHHHLD